MQSQSAEQEFNKREEGEATVVSEDTGGGHYAWRTLRLEDTTLGGHYAWRTLPLELNAEGVD